MQKQLSENRNKNRINQVEVANSSLNIVMEKPYEAAFKKQTIIMMIGLFVITDKKENSKGKNRHENKPTIDTGCITAQRIIDRKDGS